MGKYSVSVNNKQLLLNNIPLQVIGLRCSNALYSEETTQDLIDNLELYASYGINSVSVFFMGNRFGDIKGYHQDATLNPIYAQRMGKIIEAADSLGMVILVGCLYWGNSKAKWEGWAQKEVNTAVRNTVSWLQEHDYRNVIVDPDNEGMGREQAGFDTRELILAGKEVSQSYVIGSNFMGTPPTEADVALHFSDKDPNKPYIESEGTPMNAPGGYWVSYSNEMDPGNYYRKGNRYNYIRVGVYTEAMKEEQIRATREHLEKGYGYMLASTWLQAVPPLGPNHHPGGSGSETDPGIRWWLENIRQNYQPYRPK